MNKHYHLIGVGGIGVGTLASLLVDKGCRVTGSDLKENAMIQHLRAKGAQITIGHRPENLGQPDGVIYSSAVMDDNPEIVSARAKGIPIFQRAQVLARLMRSKKSITIAGAHGKTTTTSMTAHLLKDAGLDPTVAIGGLINNGLYSAGWGDGDFFVSEVDESDGTFLYFFPFYSLITNIDFEHVDHYQTWDNILAAYREFIARTARDGCLIVCGDDARLLKLAKESGRRYVTYGLSGAHDFVAQEIRCEGFQAGFSVTRQGQTIGDFSLQVPGRHNVSNALAVIALSQELKIDLATVRRGLAGFRGVQRRFTVRGEVNSILVVDDYAHHPSEIKATLAAAKQFPGRRVFAIFQPHRYTRTQSLTQEFAESLRDADFVILTDIYAASEPPIESVSVQNICAAMTRLGMTRFIYLPLPQIVPEAVKRLGPGDIVLILGAGNVNQVAQPLIDQLKTRFPGS